MKTMTLPLLLFLCACPGDPGMVTEGDSTGPALTGGFSETTLEPTTSVDSDTSDVSTIAPTTGEACTGDLCQLFEPACELAGAPDCSAHAAACDADPCGACDAAIAACNDAEGEHCDIITDLCRAEVVGCCELTERTLCPSIDKIGGFIDDFCAQRPFGYTEVRCDFQQTAEHCSDFILDNVGCNVTMCEYEACRVAMASAECGTVPTECRGISDCGDWQPPAPPSCELFASVAGICETAPLPPIETCPPVDPNFLWTCEIMVGANPETCLGDYMACQLALIGQPCGTCPWQCDDILGACEFAPL